MRRIGNIHPGEILLEEFLKPMGITAYRLSKETKIDQTRISEIIRGKRSISVDTALRFAKFFGNSAEFWINLQNHFDIKEKKQEIQMELKKIKPFVESQQQSVWEPLQRFPNFIQNGNLELHLIAVKKAAEEPRSARNGIEVSI